MKIVDPATNKIVPINTPGEVLTRGYNTMLGYWNDKDKTEEIITKRQMDSFRVIIVFNLYIENAFEYKFINIQLKRHRSDE